MPSPFIKYIQNEQHYAEVISRVSTVKESLWIGTADIKDLYVMKCKDAAPFLSVLADLLKKGVDVRLIHAKEPGPMFREDFDRFPILAADLERVCCPRVHFKLMILDMETAYIGSANLTGAGMNNPGRFVVRPFCGVGWLQYRRLYQHHQHFRFAMV